MEAGTVCEGLSFFQTMIKSLRLYGDWLNMVVLITYWLIETAFEHKYHVL